MYALLILINVLPGAQRWGALVYRTLFGMFYYCVYMIMINFLQGFDDGISCTSCNFPCVAAFGTSLADLRNPVVVVEKTMLRMPSMEMAEHFLCYYIYKIQYPPSLRQFLRAYLSSTLPTCVSVFLDSLFS